MLVRAAFRYHVPLAVLAGLLALLPFQYTLGGLSETAQYASLSIAFLTMALCVLNKAADIPEDASSPLSLPLNPSKKRAATIVATIFFLLPIPWAALHSLPFLGAYLALGAFGWMIGPGIGTFDLKKIFVIKNIAITAGFALATCTPYYFFAPDVRPRFFFMYLIGNALLMMCIDVLRDVRDMKGDRTAGIRTIANTMGKAPAQILSMACLVGYIAFTATFYRPEIPLMAAYAAMAAIIVIAPRKRHYVLYHAIPLIWIGMAAVTLLKKIFA